MGAQQPSPLDLLFGHDFSADLDLSPTLQRKVRRRIRGVAILGFTAYAISLIFAVIGLMNGDPPFLSWIRITGIAIPVVIMITVLHRTKEAELEEAIKMALGVQCLMCLLVSVSNPAYEIPSGKLLPGVTWIVPLIIMFPLLIPTPLAWTKRVSILCVLTVPVGTVIAYFMDGQPDVDLATAMPRALISPTFAACIAVIGASLVNETGIYKPKPGLRAGYYKLQHEIGKGGMGRVYAAIDEFLLRPTAVKFILPERLKDRFGGAEIAKDRFAREAEVLARLKSEHTVEVYAFNLDDEKSLYYAMELLDGKDLFTLVNKFGVVSPARATYFLAQVCESLGEAHALNLIHRDVKPHNIMVCRRYGRKVDFIKVLDFGLMIPRNEDIEPGPSNPSWTKYHPDFQRKLTQGDVILGTPDYMSPEQVKRLPLDRQSDIYSVGCVAYWLLTGKAPFEADEEEETLRRHMEEPPVRLSDNTEQTIPARLEELILSCMAKNPDHRPQDIDELGKQFLTTTSDRWSPELAEAWWKEQDKKYPPAKRG